MSTTDAGGSEEPICMPCRGTGRLISGLGGEPHEVTCPWCGGTGKLTLGVDAQQSPADGPRPGTDDQEQG